MEWPIQLLKTAAIGMNIRTDHMNHSKIIQDLAKSRAGISGERSINFFLYPIIFKDYKVFHNARLEVFNQNFEIDVMLINEKFILIIEVKNLNGHIQFDHQAGGMIQTVKGQTHLYQDPIIQVERQRNLLNLWLKEKRHPSIPIETIVCFVNRNVYLDRTQNFDSRIIYGYKLPEIYQLLVDKYSSSQTFNQDKIYDLIEINHNPIDSLLFKRYHITESDFEPGVICPSCLKKSMFRENKMWVCPHCQTQSHEAHIHMLKDFSLIFGPIIKVKQARYWLKENNRSFINYIINGESANKIGDHKNMEYLLKYDIEHDFDYLVKRMERLFRP